ncbi:protein ECERIFERUM 26-like [Ananas comosus]|uniref:Protein ECERIFERUM 26-like n=1 Tax=Ananas comosus TaxID=4615 RepID=A0A6P5G4E9_ANACO|nr:protein ECERIFERUM 26-like [Ananas comosus]
MVFEAEPAAAAAVYGHKLSSVVPGSVTGEIGRELTGTDLAMKLHYFRGVYYFRRSEVIDALTILPLKQPMFSWLDRIFPASGRIRRSEAGRPYIKCNDCGVRIIEAKCGSTVDEWLEGKDPSKWRHLVSDKVLGPDLYFSPLLYIQFTKFKCGGMAIGFSWAHVLGDAVSATNCFNLWAQLLGKKSPSKSDNLQYPQNTPENPVAEKSIPHSVKMVDPVGDYWLAPNSAKMATYSFQITEAKLNLIRSKESVRVGYFEIISALIWRNLAKIREGEELNTVTICRNDHSSRTDESLSNEQKICSLTTDSSPAKVELSELAMLISEKGVDETKMVESFVESESGKPDFIIYGANLTFVDMEKIELYGLELKGQKPVHVEYSIDGVGKAGTILVLQCGGDNKGRLVNVILPEDEISKLREMLKIEWGIA